MRAELVQVVQVIYWLTLSAWSGSVLFIQIAAPVVLRTIKENNPSLPGVVAGNLQDEHATLLAGSVVGNLLAALARLQWICASVLAVAIAAQWFFLHLQNEWNVVSAMVRTALYVAAAAIAVFDSRFLWPRIWKFRQIFIDNADDPDKANPALDQFNRYQIESRRLLTLLVFLLMGIVAISAGTDFKILVPVLPQQ